MQRSVFLCIQLIDFLFETLRVQALGESDKVSIPGKLMEVDHLGALRREGLDYWAERSREARDTCDPDCPWDKVVRDFRDDTELDLETLMVSVMNWVEAVSSMLTKEPDRQD